MILELSTGIALSVIFLTGISLNAPATNGAAAIVVIAFLLLISTGASDTALLPIFFKSPLNCLVMILVTGNASTALRPRPTVGAI